MKRGLINFLAFLGTFALVAAGIGTIVPPPVVPIVSAKVSYFQEHGDQFDVLFLGTSRTFRQIIPEMFDELMAAAGHPVKSFNLGVDGMRPPEDTYVLEHALRGRKAPLKWVFVECNPIRLSLREEDRDTLRAIYWHDAARTMALFRRAFFTDSKKRKLKDRLKKVAESWPDFEDHGWYFLQNTMQVGRGYTLLESLLLDGHLPEIPQWDLGKRRDGYRPADTPPQMIPEERAIYEQQIARMRAQPPPADFGEWVSQAELREKQRLIEQAGAKMIVLLPPYVAKRFFQPQLGGKHAPLFLNFSSVAEYPALHAPENHSDSGHLNRAGSEVYTREIVHSFLEHLN